MLTHKEMIEFQKEHDLINIIEFSSIEDYVLHLMHNAAYAQVAQLVENKRVLDLGCNTGYGTHILSSSAKKIVGVDVSEKAIESATNQYGHTGIVFQTINGETLPFDNEVFDVVICFQVIEHIVDYKKFIDEIKRVITLDGIVVFTTPNALLRLYPGMKPWNEFHVREFNFSEIKSLLDDSFKSVRIFGLFATESLYSIEVNRVARIRDYVRSNRQFSMYRYVTKVLPQEIIAILKKVLPQKMIAILKNACDFFIQRPAIDVTESMNKADVTELMNRHGVEDFFYQQNDLESALDLLAICSNNEKVFETIKFKIGKNEASR